MLQPEHTNPLKSQPQPVHVNLSSSQRIEPELVVKLPGRDPQHLKFRGQEIQKCYRQLAEVISRVSGHYEEIARLPTAHIMSSFGKVLGGLLFCSGFIINLSVPTNFGLALMIGGVILSLFPKTPVPVIGLQQRLLAIEEVKSLFFKNFKDPIRLDDSSEQSLSELANNYLRCSILALGDQRHRIGPLHSLGMNRALSILNMEISDSNPAEIELIKSAEFSQSLNILRQISRLLNSASGFAINGFIWDAENFRNELKSLTNSVRHSL